MPRRHRRSRAPQTRGHPSRSALVVASLAGLAVAVAAALLHWSAATAPQAALPRPTAGAGGKVLGKSSAPVVIEVFSDFLCSHCADFASQTTPALISEFVERGVVRLIYRHFPIVAPLSTTAAQASECAADQQKFWPYHDALFERARRHTLRSAGDLEDAAGQIGLDTTAFSQCLRGRGARERVDADRAEGERRRVSGTPTSFVNDTRIEGARPVEVFRGVINNALGR